MMTEDPNIAKIAIIDKVSKKIAKQPDKKGSPSGPNVKPKQTKQPPYK